MNKNIITLATILFVILSVCCAACQTKQTPRANPQSQETLQPESKPDRPCSADKNKVDEILDRLGRQTEKLKTYQAQVSYLFIQDPELLDARTLRTGTLYYARDKNSSRLRLSFQTRRQDDDDEEKYVEEFIFDGVWLTRIDYQLEKVDLFQQAEEDSPLDVFEFVSRYFPLIGFTKTEDLVKNFDISVLDEQQAGLNHLIGLGMKVTEDSAYKDDYKQIDFWIDKTSFLPARMLTISTENDIYDLALLKPENNKILKKCVFTLETPEHFSKNIESLKKK